MKIPIENRSSSKRVEIPVNITEEDKEYNEEYTRTFELDTKTKIII
jgi:hypothetical protein